MEQSRTLFVPLYGSRVVTSKSQRNRDSVALNTVRGEHVGVKGLVSRIGGCTNLRVEASRAYRSSALMGVSNGRIVKMLRQVLEWIETQDYDSSDMFYMYSVQKVLVGVRWEVSDLNIHTCHWRAKVNK